MPAAAPATLAGLRLILALTSTAARAAASRRSSSSSRSSRDARAGRLRGDDLGSRPAATSAAAIGSQRAASAAAGASAASARASGLPDTGVPAGPGHDRRPGIRACAHSIVSFVVSIVACGMYRALSASKSMPPLAAKAPASAGASPSSTASPIGDRDVPRERDRRERAEQAAHDEPDPGARDRALSAAHPATHERRRRSGRWRPRSRCRRPSGGCPGLIASRTSPAARRPISAPTTRPPTRPPTAPLAGAAAGAEQQAADADQRRPRSPRRRRTRCRPGRRPSANWTRDLAVERVEDVRAEHDAHDHAHREGDRERAREAARSEGGQHREHRAAIRNSRPEQDAPAERPEQPLPEEQEQADEEEEDDEDERRAPRARRGRASAGSRP